MILARARIWQLPQLAAILWAHTRAASARPCVRSRADDLALLWRATWRGRVRVAHLRGRLAGFVLRDHTRLHALYVAPGLRGQGVGRALLAEAQDQAGTLDLWVLADNLPARRFYRRAGFAEAAHAQGGGNDEGLSDIRMVWHGKEAAA